jgi:GDP-D-mannose 3', 5'-epimerase
VWGDGEQTRSFLYIDECVEGTMRLASSNLTRLFNIGSEEMITINQLAATAMDIAGKRLRIKHIPGPTGVRGRSSDNELVKRSLNWAPSKPFRVGLEATYEWIEAQLQQVGAPRVTAV